MTSGKRLILVAMIGLVSFFLVLIGTWQATTPFVSPAELNAALSGTVVQVEGIAGAITVNDTLSFVLSDGEGTTVPVLYPGLRPIALDTGRVVIVKGVYEDGAIRAGQISIRAHETTAQGGFDDPAGVGRPVEER